MHHILGEPATFEFCVNIGCFSSFETMNEVGRECTKISIEINVKIGVQIMGEGPCL